MLPGMTSQPRAAGIVDFWREAGPRRWFRKDPAFDEAIRRRFEHDHLAAARGEHDRWAETAEGALALVLLLDQVPRNLWRGTAHAWATDPLARRFARVAVQAGHDRAVEAGLRAFFYMPFQHSEDLADQDDGVRLVEAWVAEGADPRELRWPAHHRDVVRRFGRFPHRNAALGRATTPEEQAFLDSGGFAG
jgi:uncharacterized protein (DUF924 family)